MNVEENRKEDKKKNEFNGGLNRSHLIEGNTADIGEVLNSRQGNTPED